jgi:hypothetical protein
MLYEPIAECTFGWGHVLRLYPDHLDIQGVSYGLHDLIQFRPAYRRLMGVASMRLELQFRTTHVVARGIANVGDALKIVTYLNRYHPMIEDETVLPIPMLSQPRSMIVQSSPALILPDATQGRFWEYDTHSNDQPTLSYGPFDAVVDGSDRDRYEKPTTEATAIPVMLDAVPAWPWTDERHAQRLQRLQRLQSAREIHMHGFDVYALVQRLRDNDLPHVVVPLRLQPGETAHYSTPAMLCDEPGKGMGLRGKPRARDRGMFILTNKRVIYLGRKQQIVFGYEHLMQLSYQPDTIVLFAKNWSHRQCFAVKRPLECSMYFEHLLQQFLLSPPSDVTISDIAASTFVSD